jgi:hypothetical protein
VHGADPAPLRKLNRLLVLRLRTFCLLRAIALMMLDHIRELHSFSIRSFQSEPRSPYT